MSLHLHHHSVHEIRALAPALKPCANASCPASQAAPGMRYCQPCNDRHLNMVMEIEHEMGEGIECW